MSSKCNQPNRLVPLNRQKMDYSLAFTAGVKTVFFYSSRFQNIRYFLHTRQKVHFNKGLSNSNKFGMMAGPHKCQTESGVAGWSFRFIPGRQGVEMLSIHLNRVKCFRVFSIQLLETQLWMFYVL